MATVAPYGSWRSPIDPRVVAAAGRRLASPALEPSVAALEGGAAGETAPAVWWAEGRPEEGGRVVLVRRAAGEAEDVTPDGFNVRTRAHEYGGGAWALVGEETVVFANFADQRLYRQRRGEEPVPITGAPESPAGRRYADMRLAPDGRTLVCVRETHGAGEVENQLVSVALDGSGEAVVLASGRDFYSFPRVSPDGRWLAWTCWDHPNMPWDGTEPGSPRSTTPPTRAWSPAGARSRSSSPSGTRRAACTSSPTVTAGGTSTATRAGRSSS